MRKKVALFFGGASNEYTVSLYSAAAVVRALNKEKYEIYQIGIDRIGRWLFTEATPDCIERDEWQRNACPCLLSPDRGMRGIWLFQPGQTARRILPDVLLPIMHGRWGEDGCIQGLFSLSGIPYVGCTTEASAICMDKDLCKVVARYQGIPVVPWVRLSRAMSIEEARREAEARLTYPMFLKPCRSGSSVGAARVSCRAEFAAAFDRAGQEDDCVLAEEFLSVRELELALLETPEGLELSTPGEILPPRDGFYSYEAKYGDKGALLCEEAQLSPAEQRRLRDYATRLFYGLGCRGCARADFFMERSTGRLYFNEINTMPGFTAISMFPRLLTKTRSFSDLLDLLIAGAAV